MDGRQSRGEALAKAQGARIKQVEDGLWFVPSEKSGGYLVNVEKGTCTCPDHKGQRTKCKHLVAVESVRAEGPQMPLALPAPAKPTKQPKGDLTAEEQANVRAALRFLRARHGGWEPLAKALRTPSTRILPMQNRRPVAAGIAVRLARLAGVTVDDLLTGRYPPPGACPHCGQVPTPPAAP